MAQRTRSMFFSRVGHPVTFYRRHCAGLTVLRPLSSSLFGTCVVSEARTWNWSFHLSTSDFNPLWNGNWAENMRGNVRCHFFINSSKFQQSFSSLVWWKSDKCSNGNSAFATRRIIYLMCLVYSKSTKMITHILIRMIYVTGVFRLSILFLIQPPYAYACAKNVALWICWKMKCRKGIEIHTSI